MSRFRSFHRHVTRTISMRVKGAWMLDLMDGMGRAPMTSYARGRREALRTISTMRPRDRYHVHLIIYDRLIGFMLFIEYMQSTCTTVE